MKAQWRPRKHESVGGVAQIKLWSIQEVQKVRKGQQKQAFGSSAYGKHLASLKLSYVSPDNRKSEKIHTQTPI